MKIIFRIVVLGFSLALIVGTSSAQHKSKHSTQKIKFDYGIIEGSNYENHFFGFHLTLPDGWQTQSGKTTQSHITSKNDKNSVIALSSFRYENKDRILYNPSIAILFENIRQKKKIKTAQAYLEDTVKRIENIQSNIPVEIEGEVFEAEIGGKKFAALQTEILGVVEQRYYVFLSRGYAVVFLVSHASEEDEETLDKVLKSLKFY